jgi:hypothetical protein
MKVGQKVKFKEILEQGDEELRFIVLEDKGDRVLVQAVVDLPFPPTYTYLKSELVVTEN